MKSKSVVRGILACIWKAASSCVLPCVTVSAAVSPDPVESLGGIEMIRGGLDGSVGGGDLRRVVGQQAETQVVERGEDIVGGRGGDGGGVGGHGVGVLSIEDLLGVLGDGERSAPGILPLPRSEKR